MLGDKIILNEILGADEVRRPMRSLDIFVFGRPAAVQLQPFEDVIPIGIAADS
ncbi:hypothetical protein RGR602_PB00054 (plasmid) [Rhizobium gallicum bv. gallicum R602sp]|uniref:Uncharacterized protein n=1 Tax=Rhizobium gallicum bv. gallicum R602sp TaxID=1041138 RepID=A0A0B4XA27_9HYPH|nr:hypothetical protein RGR602_PB00054 [Rhizobium gallicum bv. gallicum R602sp]